MELYTRQMSAENPVNIGVELKQKVKGVLEAIVPGLREHRIEAEQARQNLDLAYSDLGGPTGTGVT